MRKSISILLISFVLFSFVLSGIAPSAVMAVPTRHPTSSIAHVKQTLTQRQREAIVAARTAFASAKSDAFNGFDRALADAKAIRDQSVLAAGSNHIAIRVANKNYKDSYRTILRVYKTDLSNAKETLLNSITAAKANK
jgi:type II secretory pathway pseudopilin PulG